MKQLKFVLDDQMRGKLETASGAGGHSLAEEVRQRLERTFAQDQIDSRTYKLMLGLFDLAEWVRAQTGHEWFEHPAASRVLEAAFDARLARLRAGKGEPVFKSDELPETRLVAAGSTDPREMGLALETLEFHRSAPSGRATQLLEWLQRAIKDAGDK